MVTGASGYIGGRLVENLLQLGYPVVSMVRRPEQFAKLFSKPTSSQHHIIRYGNTLEPESLVAALKGVDVAYYLVHSLANNKDFESLEIQSARNFVKAAEQCKVKKIIYLGGLSNDNEELSAHLRSRKAVGMVLRESKIPSITFRASIILGSGSISYELIRNLTERLPIMITPKWVRVKAQPIGVGDVLRYLIAGIDLPIKAKEYRIYEIGGVDKVSYSEIMLEYARQRGLKRFIIPVPVLTPYLSSLWLSVFTPLYSSIGKKLIDGIKISTVVKDQEKTFHDFPFLPISMSEAIKKAIEREEKEFIRTHWASSYSSSIRETTKIGDWQEQKQGIKLVYTKKSIINSSCKDAFLVLEQIGGKKGWYYANFIWKLRGLIDILLGGPGHQRGRKDPYKLHEGGFLDWWRVEQYEPSKLLRLRAEMKLPGRAWLEFELKKKDNDNNCELFLSAIFDPSGLFGILYWYSLYPVHFFIFNGLLRGLKQDIESSTKNNQLRD